MIGLESEAIRADVVLEVRSGANRRCRIESEMLLLAGTEKVMENTQTVMTADRPSTGIQPPEALGQISFYPAKVGTGVLDLSLGDRKRDVLFLYQIVALRSFFPHNAVGFPAVFVKVISALFHQDGLLKAFLIQLAVDDGNFGSGIRWQAVQHPAVRLEDAELHILGCGNVVYVGKTPCLGEFPTYVKDAV